MAESGATSLLLPILFLFLSFSLHLHSTFSLYTTTTTTTVFDVSASIQKTLRKPKNSHNSIQRQLPNNSSSSSLFFSLHSRSSLNHHQDYESLTLSRLARDAARVRSIRLSLDSAATSSAWSSKSVSTPVTSGESQGSGEYFARLGIGRPVKYFYMVIDTGSDVSWLQCKPCISCYKQSDPIYNPSASSTYHSLSCGSRQCRALDTSACAAGDCEYEVSYGDGSFTAGDFATETLSFGSSGSVRKISIGCGHENQGLFVGAAGLVGLGGGSLSLTSQLNAKSFSYCLVDSDSTGSSTLVFNSSEAENSFSASASLVRNTRYVTYRYVGLTGISVGGKRLALKPSLFAVDGYGRGGTILDSGTSVTRLRTMAYDALRDEFASQARKLKKTSGYELFDTCYDLSSTKTVAIPTVSFIFAQGQELSLPPEGILTPVDSAGTFCLAFAATDMTLSIIGNIQQQTTRVSFDLVNSVVEFTPKSC